MRDYGFNSSVANAMNTLEDGQRDRRERQEDLKNGSKRLKKAIKKRIIILGAAILALILWSQVIVITNPDEYMVIQHFGDIKRVTTAPGLSFKIPFIQNTRSIPSTINIYDIPKSDVITQDKKTMVADSFVLWKVEDPAQFVRTLSGSVSNAEVRVGNISYNSMKNIISTLPQSEIISGRDTLAVHIFDNIGDSLDSYGVRVVGIETKSLDLPNDNKEAVYTRMISERNNIAAAETAEGAEQAREIRTATDKEVSIMLSEANPQAAAIIAEGEAEYMRILAEAYNDPAKAEFYAFVRSLDAAKIALADGETTLILSADSPLAQIFYNN